MPVYPHNEVRHLALGVPARVAGPLSDERQALIPAIAAPDVRLKDEYIEGQARGAR